MDAIERGGAGATALAEAVADAADRESSFRHTYELDEPIPDKIDAIVRKVYGGDGAFLLPAARGYGDLSENFEYHAAKNEQGLLERKITILRARLEDAEIVEGGDPNVVSVGSHVVIKDDSGSRLEVEISGLGGPGKTSPSSPLGLALIGRRVGETVDVAAPKSSWAATIVEIRAAAGS